MIADKRRYFFLDGLRGIAAVAVLWGHVLDGWGRFRFESAQYVLAVDFFFMLSGFVIAHGYGAALREGMPVAAFARVRLVRLLPLTIIGALIGGFLLAITAQQQGISLWRVWASTGLAMLSLPSFLLPVFSFPVNGPGWSLFFEFVGNFIYAPLARYLRPPVLAGITLLLGIVLVINVVDAKTIELGWAARSLLGGAARMGFGFAAGLTLYAYRSKLNLSARMGLLLAGALFFLMFAPIHLHYVAHLTLILLIFPPLIWFGATVKLGPKAQKICTIAGNLSFPLYILHWPCEELMHMAFTQVDPQAKLAFIWAPLEVAIAIAIAWVCMKAIDEPVRRWLSQKTRRPAATTASVQPLT